MRTRALHVRRSWRLGLLALYLVATLIAALLPDGDAHAFAAPDGPHAMMMAGSHGDDAMAMAEGDCHPAGQVQKAPSADLCGSSSLCALAHFWLPTGDVARLVAVPPSRDLPPVDTLPIGIERAPDLRPPSLSV